MNLLAYITMKIQRAETHLNALNASMGTFLKEACTVTTHDDPKTGRCVRRTKFNPMPSEIGMELGEFLYCLRSGLDQMAWQLALTSSRQDHPRDVCFPIFDRIENSQDRRNLRRVLDLFPVDVAHEIDALQPYKSASPVEEHPLWQLNTLCNIDKHWIIPFNGRAKRIFVPRNPAATLIPLEDEDTYEVSVPLADKWQFDFDPHFPVEIELGEWDTDLVIPRRRLADIHGFIVCTVIPRFRKFDGPIVETIGTRIGEIKSVYS